MICTSPTAVRHICRLVSPVCTLYSDTQASKQSLTCLLHSNVFPSHVDLPSRQLSAIMSSRDRTVYYPHCIKSPPFSLDAPGYEPVEGETIPRRNPKAVNKLKSQPEEGVATLYDLVKRSSEKYGNAKATGFRRVVRTVVETKKVKKMVDGKQTDVDKHWTYFELSDYKYLSFIEYERLTLQLGAGLRKLRMSKGDRVHIYAASR